MSKKLLSALLAAVMLLSLIPMTVFATVQTINDSDVTWEMTNNNTVLAIGGTGDMPDFKNGYGAPWLSYSSNITTIEIGENVTKIGNCAFISCPNVSEVKASAVTPPTVGSSMLSLNEKLKIHVPAGSVEQYKMSWSSYAGYIEASPAPGYAITNGTPESDKAKNNGYITIDKETAAEGETVTITVKPNEGYQLKSLTVTPVVPTIAGALKGVFSVSADKKVYFSQGNLVAAIDASGAPTAWKFSAHQYDCLGAGGANKTIGATAGDVDFFGWSTSTNDGTSTTNNYGIKTSKKASDYSGDFYDWGKAVGDGNTWRTLSKDEWTYLFNNHSKKWATVNGVKGYVIAPDGFDGTLSDIYADDAALAANNLVFLPAAGYRWSSNVSNVGDSGYYQSSTAVDSGNVYYANFDDIEVCPGSMTGREYGCSVRLVTSAPAAPETITPAKQQDGTYQFTMPAKAVTVTAEFEAVPPELTATEAAAIAAGLEHNIPSTTVYSVTGYVTQTNGTISKGQQTFWLDDEKGDKQTFEGYWCTLPANEEPLRAGDRVTIVGNILRYNSTYEMKNGNVTILERAYSITNGTPESDKAKNNGYITIDKETAAKDETVTISVKPNEGYQLKSLVYNDGEDHSITADAQGAYTFAMPANAVTVSAELEKAITIADIIATYENFPLTKDEDLHWTNKQGTTCYYFNNNLFFRYSDNKSLMQSMTVSVAADGKNYTYSDGIVTYTFIMDDSGVLAAITVSGSTDIKYNGTYVAPPTKYTVTNGTTDMNGDIAIDKASAAEGETVTITVTPDEGYQLKSLVYNDGEDHPITADAQGAYTFAMPANAVTVSAEFEHTHAPVFVNGQAATESAAGWKDYYECDCGALSEDENGTTPIENLDAWKAEGGNGYIAPLVHNPELVNGQDATDTEAGYKPYYACNNCGKYYEDATGLIEISNIDEWKSQTGKGYIPSGNEINAAKTAAKTALDSENAKDALLDETALTNGKSAIDSAETLADIENAKNAAITAIQQAQATELANAKDAAKSALDTEEAKDPLTDKTALTNGKNSIDGATTKAAVEAAKNAAITAIQEAQATELANAKDAAKSALDTEEAKDPLTDKTALTNGKKSIDGATTKAAVEAAKNAAITAIQEAQATEHKDPTEPTEPTEPEAHEHKLVKQNGKAATKDAAGYKDYYKCDCGKYFEDATAKVEIKDLEAWKVQGGSGYVAKLGEPTSPDTSDASNTALLVMLLALTSAGAGACLVLDRKKKAK